MLTLLTALTMSPPHALRQVQTPGTVAKYIVSTNAISYAGPGTGKVTTNTVIETPVQLSVSSSNGSYATVVVSDGPIRIHGKPIGRARVHTLNIDRQGLLNGWPPAYFSVPLPSEGAQVGQTWRSGLFGPSPLPGRLAATYHLDSVQGPFARITVRVDTKGASQVVGGGTLYVRVSDGYVDHGKLKFDVSYTRPDMHDRTKFTVNNHDVVVCSIHQ